MTPRRLIFLLAVCLGLGGCTGMHEHCDRPAWVKGVELRGNGPFLSVGVCVDETQHRVDERERVRQRLWGITP